MADPHALLWEHLKDAPRFGDVEDRVGHFRRVLFHVAGRDLHDVHPVRFLPRIARVVLGGLERVVLDLDREMRVLAIER